MVRPTFEKGLNNKTFNNFKKALFLHLVLEEW